MAIILLLKMAPPDGPLSLGSLKDTMNINKDLKMCMPFDTGIPL